MVYQLAGDGKTREVVAGSYRLESSLVKFSLGRYDHSRALVIDPVGEAISFSEYTPGIVESVAVDGSGNVYVAGSTFGAANNGLFVAKYNSTGIQQFLTQIGTGLYIWAYGLAVDSNGNIDIGGTIDNQYSAIPATASTYENSTTAAYSAIFIQVAANGNSIPYATYLDGGSGDTSTTAGNAVAVDSSNNAYLTGYSESPTLPTTAGAYQRTFTGGQAGFVTKLDPTKTAAASLVYSTFVGNGSTFNGIAVDSSGDAYVTGNEPAGFPTTTGAFQYSGYESANGGAYVTKLNPTATALVYSAYLGYGTGYGIAVEGQASPSVYVTGQVSYEDFPVTAGAYQISYPGGFLTKLSADGASEVYSTFLGGPSSYVDTNYNFVPLSVALPKGCASSCNAYVSGTTTTGDMPVLNAIQATARKGKSALSGPFH